MTRHLAILALLLAAGCTTRPAPTPAHVCPIPQPCAPSVVRVVDGDTVDLLAGGLVVRCRLTGIDAPERGEPGYRAATEYTRAWLAAADRLRVEQHGLDRWNRPLVTIYRDADPISLSASLLATPSHAIPFQP